jgi:hypothetical protein
MTNNQRTHTKKKSQLEIFSINLFLVITNMPRKRYLVCNIKIIEKKKKNDAHSQEPSSLLFISRREQEASGKKIYKPKLINMFSF